MLDDKVCKYSTSSNPIDLLNSLNDHVCIVFLSYGEIMIIIIIIKTKQAEFFQHWNHC